LHFCQIKTVGNGIREAQSSYDKPVVISMQMRLIRLRNMKMPIVSLWTVVAMEVSGIIAVIVSLWMVVAWYYARWLLAGAKVSTSSLFLTINIC